MHRQKGPLKYKWGSITDIIIIIITTTAATTGITSVGIFTFKDIKSDQSTPGTNLKFCPSFPRRNSISIEICGPRNPNNGEWSKIFLDGRTTNYLQIRDLHNYTIFVLD